MDAIDTITVETNGATYRITVHADEDAPNPLEDWSEMGTILSLNRRHRNFDPAGVAEAIAGNPDAVKLSYYEHGLCRWSVTGELPFALRCPWDSVAFAGVWLPDAETLASARKYGSRTRRLFMRKRARQVCEAYTQWCNGEVYGYRVERVTACGTCHGEHAELLESCWGFFGLDYCLSETRAACDHAGCGLAA
jgi:hypothetical protein